MLTYLSIMSSKERRLNMEDLGDMRFDGITGKKDTGSWPKSDTGTDVLDMGSDVRRSLIS